ncbi:MAG: penicillin-binding transpeptidase domain-containing protein [Oscillospiraceae bacterium]|jgi:stage V sporulation protein D (sporulation-specific penicillin-binding protein)
MAANGPTRKMRRRIFIVVVPIIAIAFVSLLARICVISVVDGSFYQSKASNQQLRDVTINPKRGTIYDRNMTVLAQSATVWTVFISPNDIPDDDTRVEIATGLSEILELDYETVYQKTLKENYYEVVQKKVEADTAEKINEFKAEKGIGSIYLVEDSKRYYPYNNFASTVIGFTGADNQGLYGIEAYYDEYLKGEPGRIVTAKNAVGSDMPFQYEKRYEAKDGYGLVLTIDEVIQHFLENALDNAVSLHKVENRAAGIVMDVNTGEILAMATKPDFNLNEPFEIADEETAAAIAQLTGEEQKQALSEARELQWKNKAITELYEPGSVFKIVTGSAALEEKTVSLDTTFNCTGVIQIPGLDKPMHCWRLSGHGVQNFVDAMINSCNPAFVAVGSSLGATKFCDYVNAFGFMEKTGIDLPGEASSIVYQADQMGPVELASCSFGQSNKITPLQMITATAAVVNGGYVVQPHVVKQVLDQNDNVVENIGTTVKRQAISNETSATMRDVLEQVVVANGGSNAYISGFRIGGKSGTAQKLDADREEGEGETYISSFVGFAPADDPQIAVLIIVDTPTDGQIYGSVVAAPAVSEVLKQTLPYLGVEAQYSDDDLSQMDVTVPYVVGKDPMSAESTLTAEGLTAKKVGSGSTVVKQVPGRGSSVPKGSTVILYTEEGEEQTVEVPKLVGLTPSQANTALTNKGLNIKFDGGTTQQTGAVVATQSVAEGTVVAKGTVISVTCIKNDETG